MLGQGPALRSWLCGWDLNYGGCRASDGPALGQPGIKTFSIHNPASGTFVGPEVPPGKESVHIKEWGADGGGVPSE